MEKFSASEQSLGYHYQIRYSLYLLLANQSEFGYGYIRLEKLDDIEIGAVEKRNVLQTKFHCKTAPALSDKSVDLWKTIRIWSELVKSGEVDVESTKFGLLTTAETVPDSIAARLIGHQGDSKSIDEIVALLDSAASTSKNKELKEAFKAYQSLEERQKKQLVKNIFVRDKTLDFEGLKDAVKRQLEICVLPERADEAFEDLQGWWYEQCIQHLEGSLQVISYDRLTSRIREIANRFSDLNLPIDAAIRDMEPSEQDFDNRVFVSQLRLVGAGQQSIYIAIRNYYRAYEQRMKWLRTKPLNPEEEIDYERALSEDWQVKFAALQDECVGLDDLLVRERGRVFYISFYVNSVPAIYIRPKVTESFITRGSCHILADKLSIGWHPKYEEALK